MKMLINIAVLFGSAESKLTLISPNFLRGRLSAEPDRLISEGFFYIWFSVQYFSQQLSSTTVKNTDVTVIISRPTHHPLNGANCITKLPVILPAGGEDVGNCVMNEVKEFIKICKMKMQVIGVVLLKLKN